MWYWWFISIIQLYPTGRAEEVCNNNAYLLLGPRCVWYDNEFPHSHSPQSRLKYNYKPGEVTTLKSVSQSALECLNAYCLFDHWIIFLWWRRRWRTNHLSTLTGPHHSPVRVFKMLTLSLLCHFSLLTRLKLSIFGPDNQTDIPKNIREKRNQIGFWFVYLYIFTFSRSIGST